MLQCPPAKDQSCPFAIYVPPPHHAWLLVFQPVHQKKIQGGGHLFWPQVLNGLVALLQEAKEQGTVGRATKDFPRRDKGRP